MIPADYPERYLLANEVHARPSESVGTPSRATCIAILVPPDERARELAHMEALCRRVGVLAPIADTIHFTVQVSNVRLKWERHGEFSSYTFSVNEASANPFEDTAVSLLPKDWVSGLPGKTIFAGHAAVLPLAAEAPDAEELAGYFRHNTLVGATVGGGGGVAFTDFRIHEDGFSRFLLFNRHFTPDQSGRVLQRLFEIETYRMMALLALPMAREQSRRLSAIERDLATVTDDIARGSVEDEKLLHDLTKLAVEVESRLAGSQFRFGACKAYHDLVIRRIAELREERLPVLQTIGDFMIRRFTPAASTCASTAQRLHDLSERVAQTSSLLSTRVDIARQKQNQLLLASMNKRARLHLRLQRTVEVLSVIPITYYLVALLAYVFKALSEKNLPVDPVLAAAIAIPVVMALVVLVLLRAHHKVIGNPDLDEDPKL